jgi:hypothetical protein
MTYKNFLTFASVLGLAFGLGFSLIPAQLTNMYNVSLNAGGLFVGQLFGSSLLGLGLLNWFARDFSDSSAKQAVLLANLVDGVVGFIFALLAQLGGVAGVNALGWSTVVIYLILAAGFAYLRFFSK